MLGKARAPRLSIEDRREQILDSAVRLILGQGVLRCTLESVATEAGISKALIYRHFSSREELFKAVIDRENCILRDRNLVTPTEAETFEEALRISHPRTFAYLHERGPVIRAMFLDRSVERTLHEYLQARRWAQLDFYIDKVSQAYGVPRQLAMLGVLITINAPVGASRALRSYHVDPADAAEFWTTFILGGWAAISALHGLEQI